MKPAEAGDSGRAAMDIVTDAGAFLTYTDATVQTGLSYWQLRHAVKRGYIPATLGGPGRVAKLSRHAVLEYATSKGYLVKRPVTSPQLEPFVTSELPPDFWASEPAPLPDFNPQARREPSFTVLPEPSRSAKLPRRSAPSELSLRVLQEADRLYIRLRGELAPLPSAAGLLKMLAQELHTFWNQKHQLEFHADDLRRVDPATEHGELERCAATLFTRLARIYTATQRCDYNEGDDAPF